MALVGLFLALGVALVLVGFLFVAFEHRLARPSAVGIEAVRLTPPAPRLETSRAGDRAAVQAAADRLIGTYGWIDRAAGRARIPLTRAMAIVAAHGWPDPPAARSGSEPAR